MLSPMYFSEQARWGSTPATLNGESVLTELVWTAVTMPGREIGVSKVTAREIPYTGVSCTRLRLSLPLSCWSCDHDSPVDFWSDVRMN